MNRQKAIAIMVQKVERTSLFYNMQPHGLIKAYNLDISPALTSAMGLGGGQTPVIVQEL